MFQTLELSTRRREVYLVLLLWTFTGVAIVSDIFMSAIEVITSKELVRLRDTLQVMIRSCTKSKGSLPCELSVLYSTARVGELQVCMFDELGTDFL